jgi:type III secretory pathway component EscT
MTRQDNYLFGCYVFSILTYVFLLVDLFCRSKTCTSEEMEIALCLGVLCSLFYAVYFLLRCLIIEYGFKKISYVLSFIAIAITILGFCYNRFDVVVYLLSGFTSAILEELLCSYVKVDESSIS